MRLQERYFYRPENLLCGMGILFLNPERCVLTCTKTPLSGHEEKTAQVKRKRKKRSQKDVLQGISAGMLIPNVHDSL